MLKPQSLRNFIVDSCQELRREPANLQMHIESGNVIGRLTANLGFETQYKLSITVLNYTSHPFTIFLPLMIWLRTNELMLYQNFDKAEDGVKFEIDIMDNDTYDIAIELPLIEAVNILRGEDGTYTMTNRNEPALIGSEGTAALTLLPEDIVLLVNAYGELIRNRAGAQLTPPD